jgi:hypothetical protein
LQEEVIIHVAQMGTLPLGGLGKEKDEGGESPEETEENRLLQLLK